LVQPPSVSRACVPLHEAAASATTAAVIARGTFT
jgi:hypothetical protein